MQFNNNLFKQKIDGLKLREDKIKVISPDLKKFFMPEGEEKEGEEKIPFWHCRQLTAIEVAMVNQEVSNSKNMEQWIEGLLAGYTKDKVNAVKNIVGIGTPEMNNSGEPETLPDEYVRRMYMVLFGLTNPKPEDIQWVRKFALNWPQEFYLVSTKIINLTGLGAEVGE